jgi:hypothetical protein
MEVTEGLQMHVLLEAGVSTNQIMAALAAIRSDAFPNLGFRLQRFITRWFWTGLAKDM